MSTELTRLRWWHLAEVLVLERSLFGDDPWTAYHFWSELGQVQTRHYLVADDAFASSAPWPSGEIAAC